MSIPINYLSGDIDLLDLLDMSKSMEYFNRWKADNPSANINDYIDYDVNNIITNVFGGHNPIAEKFRLFVNKVTCQTVVDEELFEEIGESPKLFIDRLPIVRNSVQVYVDISNISAGMNCFINPVELHKYVVGNSIMTYGLVVGSFPDKNNGYWELWRNLGYLTDVHNAGKEKGVDDTLHANILYNVSKNPSLTIIIITGDGNNNDNKTSFPKCIDLILTKTQINVIQCSWKGRLNDCFKQFLIYNRYSIKYLDHIKDKLLN